MIDNFLLNAFQRRRNYGTRADGSNKGSGFFGELQRPDGSISTELSIGIDGEEIPSLVPLLSNEEKDYLLNGGSPSPEIIQKAIQHATERRKQGKSPFYQEGEARPYAR